jgi:uncharacterized protein
MKQATTAPQTDWASSNALGLFGFGLTTFLLQIHNLGLMDVTMPVCFGFFWGGLAQVIAGVIAGKKNDLFHLTAFTSYGVFWIALAFSFILNWTGVMKPDLNGYAWSMIAWAIFTFALMIGTLKDNFVSFFIFLTLTILFVLLALVFFGHLSSKVAGAEGLFCAAAATYAGAAVVINNKFGRTVLPLGTFSSGAAVPMGNR